MTERQLVALAVAVIGAALVPLDLGPASIGVRMGAAATVVAAWRFEAKLLFAVTLVTLTSVQAGAAWRDAAPSDVAASFAGEARLRSDPESVAGGVRVRAEIDGRIHDLRAWGSAAGWLRPRLMGEIVAIEATLRPLNDPPRWLLAQGIRGRGTVTGVSAFREGRVHTRVANSVRRTIEAGASSLDRDDRALFTGLVYGDDRAQNALVADDFAAAGLTHLLAVSGQNVAFVLALSGPLLRRLGHRERYLAVGLLLLVFATMTRFEPSVVRASVMTGIAATGALVGTAVSSRRVLLIAVVGLMVVRPMLVYSVAFQLSVAASAGILLWSGRLARSVPGPRVLVEMIAVTASAQLAVAPLLLWRFGEMPVASLPANVLAGPVAGPVMMWGMSAGWLAGLVPQRLAAALHVPTEIGVGWIAAVARMAAVTPLGAVGAWHLSVVAGAAWFGLRQVTAPRRWFSLAVIVVVLALPAVQVLSGSVGSDRLASGTVVMAHADTTVVVVDGGRTGDVLSDLRGAHVERIDLLVVSTSSYAVAELIGFIQSRYSVGEVWAPAATMGRGEVVPGSVAEWPIGSTTLAADVEGDRLTLRPAGDG